MQPSEESCTYRDYEVDMLAKTVWGEARDCAPEEQELVIWCILNRAKDWNMSVESVITAPNQFGGYSATYPVSPKIRELCQSVVDRWERGEKALIFPPFATSSNYKWFRGDGRHNWFREEY